MNDKRIDLGLGELNNEWKLDSIQYIDQDNIYYPYTELTESKFWYNIRNLKYYCQHWTNTTKDTLNPYHKTKRIFYVKSFWLWKNKLEAEWDEYINPISKFENVELYISYNFAKERRFNQIDTLETDYKIQSDLKKLDSLNNLGVGGWICGTDLFDFELDTIGLSKTKTDKIFRSWKLK